MGSRPTMAYVPRPKLNILRNYAIALERNDTISGPFDIEAIKLCAFLIDCLPSGTIQEFSKITGADVEKIFDIGNGAFRERPK